MTGEATPAESSAPDNEAVNPQLVAAAAALVNDQAETDSLAEKKNGELAAFIYGKIVGDLPEEGEAPAAETVPGEDGAEDPKPGDEADAPKE